MKSRSQRLTKGCAMVVRLGSSKQRMASPLSHPSARYHHHHLSILPPLVLDLAFGIFSVSPRRECPVRVRPFQNPTCYLILQLLQQ